MQYQLFTVKERLDESAINSGAFLLVGVSSRTTGKFIAAPGGRQLSEFLASPGFVVHAALWIVSFNSAKLQRTTCLRLSAGDVLVESPPLQQKGEALPYRLFDEKGRSFDPETASTPCLSIDSLFKRS